MPLKDPDFTDPMTLHHVVVETDGPDPTREMAQCFIEEFLRMGFSNESVLELFLEHRYAGPRMAYDALGEQELITMIAQAASPRRGRRGHAAPAR